MRIATFDTGARVYVNSKYDKQIYDSVVVGAEFELVKDGSFDKIKYDKPAPKGNAGIAVAQEKKAEYIRQAQDRKEESIAYFNSCNLALQALGPLTYGGDIKKDPTLYKESFVMWRNFFYQEWLTFTPEDNVSPF